MTRPAPRPQYRSADYSLKYQVMLETLNNPQQKCEPPFKFNAPMPSGVNDLNRPMLLNTTSSKWKEMGIMAPSHQIKRPKYQQQKLKRGSYNTNNLKHQRIENAKNNGELAALSKLMEQTTNGGRSQVRRSKSEPMYLPPIDERTLTPGSRLQNQTPGTKGYKSPSYDVIKKGRKTSDGLGSSVTRRPDSTMTHTLPTLSKVAEEKAKYKDGSFIKGVQRHTGMHNVNVALGRPPPRTPRYSWEEKGKAVPLKDQYQKAEVNKPDVQQVPIRLRDMDLAFPMKNKVEKMRQWHENQFHKHLQQWKHAGSEADKKEEAAKLLARYLEKESGTNSQSEKLQVKSKPATTCQDGNSEGRILVPRTDKMLRTKSAMTKFSNISKNNTKHQGKNPENHPANQDELEAPSILHPENQNDTTKDNKSKVFQSEFCAERDKKTDNVSEVFPRPAKLTRPIKGRKVEDHVVYTDASQYIEENNLLPLDKSRRISDWLDSMDLTRGDVSPDSASDSGQSVQAESESDMLSEFGYQPG